MNLEAVGLFQGSTGGEIELGNGVRFDLFNPDPQLIDIEVVAHSLANLCRFTGHVRRFYSVAQHCVIVSENVDPIFDRRLAAQGLLHDAAEAFIGDFSRPLKVALNEATGNLISNIEDRILEAIGVRFGVPLPADASVKIADNIALATEKRDFMPIGEPWAGLPEPLGDKIIAWDPSYAEARYLDRAVELGLA